jgi:hypothetical protein
MYASIRLADLPSPQQEVTTPIEFTLTKVSRSTLKRFLNTPIRISVGRMKELDLGKRFSPMIRICH